MNKITNPTQFRSNIRQQFKIFELDDDTSTNLEIGIFNYAIKESTKNKIIKKWENPLFVQIYKDRLYSIYTNLKKDELVKRIRTKELTPQIIAFMTHQEMDPSRFCNHSRKKCILSS